MTYLSSEPLELNVFLAVFLSLAIVVHPRKALEFEEFQSVAV